MIIHFFSLLNIIDKIHIDVLEILREIDEAEDPIPNNYISNIEEIKNYANTNLNRTPLDSLPRKTNLLMHLTYAEKSSRSINPIKFNLIDVVKIDIPNMRKGLLEHFNNYVDSDLLNQTNNLLETNELTSAVRQSFILLSTRLRTALNIPQTTHDGVTLIDCVFSESSNIKFRDGKTLTINEKKYFKSILSGFYSSVRNVAAHEPEISVEAAHASLATINYALKTLHI